MTSTLGVRVDASPVKQHVRALLDAGMTYEQIADAAELGPNTVRYIQDRARVTPETAERILSLEPVVDSPPVSPTRLERATTLSREDTFRDRDAEQLAATEEQLGDWRARAECRTTDTAVFFQPRGASVEDAREICRRCPVRSECLDYAVATHQRYGMWGGLSERQRRNLRRTRIAS